MNVLENKMVELLIHMREQYHLAGVKGEFEAEGAQLEELMRLKEVAARAGVDLAVKIGGCEAISDMRTAAAIGAEQVIAPMIESAFAVKKFISAAKTVYSGDDLEKVKLLINVETITGAANIGSMIALPEAAILSGLDIGRIDLSGSMNLSAAESNSERVFELCRNMCEQWSAAFADHPCTLGGFLTHATIGFLTRMAEFVPVGCESKKTIFTNQVISENHLREAYLKAIEFEQLWYQNCMNRYQRLSSENWEYFKALDGYAAVLNGNCPAAG